MTGTVKWFNNVKGYGFITIGAKEAFVHYSQIMGEGYKTLGKNEKVEIEKIVLTDKGYQAQVVKKLSI